MTNKDVMIFNLPATYTEKDIQEMCSVKGVIITKVDVLKALDSTSTAGVKISLASPY